MRPLLHRWLLLPVLLFAACAAKPELLYEPKPTDPNDGYDGFLAEAGINTTMDWGPKESLLLSEFTALKEAHAKLKTRFDDLLVEKQNLLGRIDGEAKELDRERKLRAQAEAEAELLRSRRRELEAKILSLGIEKARLEQQVLMAKIDALQASLDDAIATPVEAAAPPQDRK